MIDQFSKREFLYNDDLKEFVKVAQDYMLREDQLQLLFEFSQKMR